LTKHFQLIYTILSTKSVDKSDDEISLSDLDLARIFVGIAKGNKLKNKVIKSIYFDFQTILSWKLTRESLQ